MDGNYIKINRSILDWEWYRNINTKILFLHMLLKANWKDGKFEGTTVPRGSFIGSYPRLAEECDLTINELRTALKHLTSTGEITVKKHAKYSVFAVNNYCLYQDINSQNTGNEQSINVRLTTIERGKEEKREGGKKKTVRFAPPTVDEVEAYCLERKNSVSSQKFVDFYSAKDWMIGKNKMKDWKAAVRNWESNTTAKGADNKFNQFPQNTYDFGELEKELVSN